MRLRISLQREAVPLLRQMAKEVGVGLSDMAEIAVYNLIAGYMHDNPEKVPPEMAAPTRDNEAKKATILNNWMLADYKKFELLLAEGVSADEAKKLLPPLSASDPDGGDAGR